MSTLGKEYAILLKTKTKTDKEKRIKTMKVYHTECIASIGVDENTQIAMTINGKIVVVKIPSNDLKISEYSDDFREGDTLSDWIVRNGKEL